MPADTTITSDIIASKAIQHFKNALAPLRMFSASFSDDAIKGGETIKVPLVSGVTATADQNDYETSTGKIGSADIAMTGYAKSTVGLTDLEMMNCSVLDLETYAEAMADAVATQVITEIFKKVTTTNFNATLGTIAANTSIIKLVRMARSKLTTNKAPMLGRSFIASQEAFDMIADDESFKFYSSIAGESFMKEGSVPRIMGFDTFEGNILPTAAAKYGFVCHNSALAVATRPVLVSKGADYAEYRVITDQDSGISLSMRKHYSTAKGKWFYSLETNYGSAIGNKDGLLILPAIPTA